MKAVHVRDIEPTTLDALKRLARCHRRSLQGELHAILAQAVRMAPPEQAEEALHLITVKTGGTSSWSRAEIYDDQGR